MKNFLYKCAFTIFPTLKHRYYRELLNIFIDKFTQAHHDIEEVSSFGIQMVSVEAHYLVINGNSYLDIICREMSELNLDLEKLNPSKAFEIADLELTSEMTESDKSIVMEKCNSIYNEIKSHYLTIFTEILNSIK